MKYKIDDSVLVKRIKQGDSVAESVIYNKYRLYCYGIANEAYRSNSDSGISFMDFFTVAFSSVYFAIQQYDDSKESFYTFWRAIVRRQIYSYIRDNSYVYGAKTFVGTSFDEETYGNGHLKVSDVYGERELYEEDAPIDFDGVLNRFRRHGVTFDEGEIEVLRLILENRKNEEIAAILGISMAQLYYRRRKIRDKIKPII